jgi:hypothetical protein
MVLMVGLEPTKPIKTVGFSSLTWHRRIVQNGPGCHYRHLSGGHPTLTDRQESRDQLANGLSLFSLIVGV